jgi:undecaprenyl-diphosphatase
LTYFNAVILGIVQGLTEFLPVSSSGHLTMLQYFFNINGDSVVIFTIMLHIGTLISVFYMYWKDIWELIKELVRTIIDLCKGRGLRMEERPVRKLGIMIIVASIPTGIIGILFNDLFESFYKTLTPTAIGLIITGILLWASETVHAGGRKIEDMRIKDALIIGTMQGIAITPGISRSGSTLVGGLFTRLDRDFAVEFAFLISIPSILGSLIFESGSGSMSAVSGSMGPVIVGMVCAAVSGVFAIKTMIKVVRRYSLKYFSYYVWIVGALLLIVTAVK